MLKNNKLIHAEHIKYGRNILKCWQLILLLLSLMRELVQAIDILEFVSMYFLFENEWNFLFAGSIQKMQDNRH